MKCFFYVQRRTTRSKLRERKPTKMMELTSSPGHSDDTEDAATPVRQSKRYGGERYSYGGGIS